MTIRARFEAGAIQAESSTRVGITYQRILSNHSRQAQISECRSAMTRSGIRTTVRGGKRDESVYHLA